MKKDTILHTMTKLLVRNWRTRVLSGAHSNSITSALTQGRYLCLDEILASLRWQARRARATKRRSRDYVSCPTSLRLVVSLLLMVILGVSAAWGTDITNAEQLNAMSSNGDYVIKADITIPESGYTTKASFTGTLTAAVKDDGTYYTISGLKCPLFTTATGATISNIMFKSIAVSGSGSVGAICGTANGATRIYNCGILPALNSITYDDKGVYSGFGSTVSSSDGNCGGLVGTLAGNARVINCFSYANITGGTAVAGIVGNNTTTSITQSNIGEVGMVVNCMFYGDIKNGSTICPVYGGSMIKNDADNGVNPYCYFRGNAAFNNSTNFGDISKYNRSWPAEEEYLTRFEYYRSILNSNRQLCTYWVTGKKVTDTENPTQAQTSADTALIAKWVLDASIAPYPILKKWNWYPSIINPDKTKTIDPRTRIEKIVDGVKVVTTRIPEWTQRSTAKEYEGKTFSQSLSVTVSPGTTVASGGHAANGLTSKTISLPISDMDTLNYDYGYYKVQLPYYNQIFGDASADPATEWDKRYGGNYKNYVVTGWKITSMNKTGKNSFVANWESGYNFADRDCTEKDIFSSSNPRVFAQGGFFYVPEGVTSINIEAYWGKAFYLHNTGHYIDRVNITNQTANGNRKLGDPFTSAGILPNTFQEKNVYDDWEVAIKALDVATESSGKLSLTVYDQALVLLSNFQVRNENGKIGKDVDSKWHPYTLMSADLDMDNEPDYCFEFQFRKEYTRPGIQPIRFDFLPVPELGMAVRHNEQQNTIGIFIPQGHFEITETAFMHTTQFEYDSNIGKIESPVILNGGNFEQIVVRYGSTSNTGPANKTSYFLLGGHFRLLRFTPGAHANTGNTARVRLCAVNAVGGEYPEFYLSGIYRPDITLSGTQIAAQGNPHCYINGGKFNLIAGAGYDKVYGNITFKIDHAYIGEFYGGGINGSNYVGGNIDVTIDHSFVTKYCGGPKVGKMVEGKTVTTNATGTKFIQYYGGGNGGTSYYRWKRQDGNAAMPASTADGWKNYGYGTFNPLNSQLNNNKQYEGPETDLNRGYNALFEFECFVESNGIGANPTLRSYMHWAQFGTTSTGNITNNLTDCIFENNFYGGGNLANVSGNVTSTLTNCTVNGNAFGGGYSGKIEPFRIHDRTKTEFPYIDKAGIMHNGALYYVKDGNDDRYYTWCYKDPTTGKMYPEGVTIPNTATTNNPTFQDDGKWYVLTTVPLNDLGSVTGNVTLNIEGTTTVKGNVYGGGEESNVNGNTAITMSGGTIGNGSSGNGEHGNVFGGGKGKADNFTCDKAMIGEVDKGVNDQGVMQPGGTTVNITNGTVEGSVYGGGQIARVERNTVVTIGAESGDSSPIIRGSVFGAGKGEKTHGYSALVRGTATVTVQGDAKVGESVYGGGEIASVGNFFVKGVTYPAALNAPIPPEDFPVGMPYALKYPNTASGTCTVTIRGNAEIGPDNMEMPTYSGHVFGAGKGILPEVYSSSNKPQRMTLADDKVTSIWESFEDEPAYIEFIETLGMSAATEVSIEGNAFVKGSVYGGSENGHVLKDTHVTIAGGQIGNGDDGQNKRFTGWDSENASDFAECNHWPYGKQVGSTKVYLPYDLYDLDADNKPQAASDGHTFYGNVFGGGSGYFPYRSRVASLNLDTNPWVKDATKSAEVGQPVDAKGYSDGKWLRSAGAVYGNTVVDITGGHILTSVYGGNEQTDVGKYQTSFTTADAGTGKCTVNMSGGTIGVPRTEQQMKDHPVTCYLFGAGKGDQRINFNTWTNVASVEVNITGGRIFGSVFGGGEDGHVMGDVEMNISGNSTTIGTTGTSYVDGNVFGGGRGFSGDAQTAGTVGGNIELNISGGLMLGSVYGGGRLASVGTQFASPDDDNYGNFVEDNEAVLYTAEEATAYNTENNLHEGDDGYKNEGDFKTPAGSYGHVTINISGGTIGNEVGNAVSGNVFGGSMGRLELLNGGINPIWPKMAQVKTTAVNIYKDAIIKRSVYGGGELGTVRDNAYVTIGGYKTADVDENGVVGVSVQGGGTVGRDVYGGGYGSEDDDTKTVFTVKELPDKDDPTYQSAPTVLVDHTYAFTPMQFAGCVGQNTFVHICGGQVKKSVYGGGELASVGIINCRAKEVASEPSADKVVVEHKNGSSKWTIYSNMVKHAPVKDSNDNDVYYGFGLSWPYEFSYVPGFDGATHVHITGGRIGLKDSEDNNFEDGDNGDVCGGGKGKAGDYNDYVFCANVGSTEVIVNYANSNVTPTSNMDTGDCITGAVYGGAENGHVMGDSKLKLMNGLVGHSIYGGGSGKGQFKTWLKEIEGVSNVVSTSSGTAPRKRTNDKGEKEYEATCYSITAGKVFGNTEVEMTGGYVVRNVYGGGNMGSVGKGNYSGGSDDYYAPGYGELPPSDNQQLWTTAYTEENKTKDFPWQFLNSGKCTVKITGGEVGYINESDLPNSLYPKETGLPFGNVFGGSRGVSAPNIGESPRYLYCPEFFMGYVNQTSVTIGTENDNTDGPKIAASVYGGGMDGHVRRDASVKIYSGTIGRTYDATKLNANFWANIGNVYGAGSGTGQYQYDFNYDGDYGDAVTYLNPQTNRSSTMKETDYSTSAGSVTRFTDVEVKGGTIYRNVYGGGSLSTVGAPKIPVNGVMPPDPFHPNDSQHSSDIGRQSLNEVVISGGQIGDESSYDPNGNHVYGGYVFGASRGDDTLENPASFATAVWTDVNINPHTDPSKSPIIYGDVYGGGEVGAVRQSTDVDLTGGTIKHDAYGGGRGTETVAANVGADATISLNKDVANDKKGCIVSRLFGCNNMNGSPQGHATVHVYATQNKNKTTIQDGKTTANLHTAMEAEGTPSTYDIAAVYGGGNMAPYYPSTATVSTESTEVIIDGCNVTSIKQVYGGGNAASAPATSVTVNGTYEIEELFGGGNGKDRVSYDGGLNYIANPGANVGYKDYHEVENDPQFATKEARVDGDDFADYRYGSGVATVNVFGGLVHHVFGGSNTKGNVRKTALTLLEEKKEDGETPCCPFQVDEAYGGGKSAPMDAEAILHMACIPGLRVAYGGAQEADVQDNVTLTITNGTFDQVFGGNNISGIIRGSITVNIEETGCKPIIIGELYGGGNLAGYSVYGYKKESRTVTETNPDTGSDITKQVEVWVPIEDASESELTTPSKDPAVNVRSFTSIGNVYGGGLGSTAIMVGNPTVNINEAVGEHSSTVIGDNATTETIRTGVSTADGGYPVPSHVAGEIGAINNVFGGGNAAKVVGKTTVNIGTKVGEDEYMVVNVEAGKSLPTLPSGDKYYVRGGTAPNYTYIETDDTTAQADKIYCKKYEIKGVDIRGNVYGGGNQAEVTGDADVIIGKKNLSE